MSTFMTNYYYNRTANFISCWIDGEGYDQNLYGLCNIVPVDGLCSESLDSNAVEYEKLL
jgi:hypothetical protein